MSHRQRTQIAHTFETKDTCTCGFRQGGYAKADGDADFRVMPDLDEEQGCGDREAGRLANVGLGDSVPALRNIQDWNEILAETEKVDAAVLHARKEVVQVTGGNC